VEDIQLPIVTSSERTPDGMGWLFRMEPGKRVLLDQHDLWGANGIENLLDPLRRVSLSAREKERRRLGALRLQEQFSTIPFYARAAERDGPGYWTKFYDSRVNS